jgi:hypothetical protein
MPRSGYACRRGFVPPVIIVTGFNASLGRRGSSISRQPLWQAMLSET